MAESLSSTELERPSKQEAEEILRVARERFATIVSLESQIREEALEDQKFVYNVGEGQWPASIRDERALENRPCLTANKLRKFCAVVSNQAVASRPSIGVIPVDSEGDVDTARIFESLIHQIEYQSSAPAIYQKVLEHVTSCGMGYWRILTRYCGDSFDQEIYLEAVDNPLSVFLDPDRHFAFVRISMTKGEFERRFPNAENPPSTETGFGGDYKYWVDKERVYVAEYFWKEPVVKTLAQVQNALGEVSVIVLEDGKKASALAAQGLNILQTREIQSYKVRWAVMTGSEILSVQDWAGDEIPVIEVCGDKQEIDGKLYKRSLIRDAKDPQRMYNYWLTAQTEAIALVPKAPYLVTPEMVRGHETMWGQANIKNYSHLLYNQTSAGRPVRERPPDVQVGAMSMLRIADEDIKDVIGIFEPGLGDVSNERSGRAIKLRQARSDMGTGHFHEQFKNALVQTGKQLINLIPRIYDTSRVVRLRNATGESELVPINTALIDPATGEKVVVNDISVGRYDIEATVKVYQTRREEATEMMVQALQYAPSIAPYILDLIFKYADWPGAEEIAARIRSVLASQAQGQPNQPAPGEAAQPSAPEMVPPGG